MARGCIPHQFDLAQGPSGRGQGAGGLDHRSVDVAGLLQKARAEFDEQSKKTPYFSLLPPDATPPVELNQAEMEKYRPEMRKFYLNKTPRLQ